MASSGSQGRCIKEAARTGLIGRDLNPSNANFISDAEVVDNLGGRITAGRDVLCGFGENDFVITLEAGDVFLGFKDTDRILAQTGGVFLGGEGNDEASGFLADGTFNGGEGVDLHGCQWFRLAESAHG